MIERFPLLCKSFMIILLSSSFFLSLRAQDILAVSYLKKGTASFYNNKFNGRKTSSGERVDNSKFTAAHSSIPFGTLVRVTNQSNGKSVVVKVNDRFYPRKGHLIDITYSAAQKIDMVRQGVARVTLEILDITETEAEAEAIVPTDTITFRIPLNPIKILVERPAYKRMIP